MQLLRSTLVCIYPSPFLAVSPLRIFHQPHPGSDQARLSRSGPPAFMPDPRATRPHLSSDFGWLTLFEPKSAHNSVIDSQGSRDGWVTLCRSPSMGGKGCRMILGCSYSRFGVRLGRMCINECVSIRGRVCLGNVQLHHCPWVASEGMSA